MNKVIDKGFRRGGLCFNTCETPCTLNMIIIIETLNEEDKNLLKTMEVLLLTEMKANMKIQMV